MKRRTLLLAPWCSAALAEALLPGDAVADCELTDSQGRVFHLQELRGRALAVTFMFTRCPLPDYCPLLHSRFAAVQQELARTAAAASWHLLSLSFDPEHDTPPQLRAFAAAHACDERSWTFATAAPEVVRTWGAAFGLEVSTQGGLLEHNLRTLVLDASGRVQRIFKGREWTVADLVWELRKAMPLSS